ncbi:alpha/beta fold hydrolase [Arthrobacter sp. A5]|uniref:alpha/beta fold hydrolase n=1 Tax=Arthrobacter sp. A5 TaxID=576926 RepID=UPI003DAA060E
MVEKVQSTDGTTIAYETAGSGPPLILVGGALNTRKSPGGLVPLLVEDFTVVTYDRRGRGESTDTPPYAVEREVEDFSALVAAVGGSAGVYGHSSGGILALEAAAAGVGISRLAAYERPISRPREETCSGRFLLTRCRRWWTRDIRIWRWRNSSGTRVPTSMRE